MQPKYWSIDSLPGIMQPERFLRLPLAIYIVRFYVCR